MDSSAFVKLPLREPEHSALRAELARWSGFVSSALLRVEAIRACARYGEAYAEQARVGIESVSLVPVDDAVLERAAELEPQALRSLDAVHLATALSLGADLGTMIVYDTRLRRAAIDCGVTVSSPGTGR